MLNPRRWRAWWPAILLGWVTIGAYGVAHYSFGVLLPSLREATGWSTGAVAGAYSVGALAGGFVGLVSGRMLDRAGSRPVLLGSLALGSAGLLLASWARSPLEFIVAWGVGGGVVAGGLFYHVTMAVTVRLYPDRRAAAFSVLTLLGALASPIFYPIAGWLVEALDWRGALRVLVALLVLCALPGALAVRSKPSLGPSALEVGATPRRSLRAELMQSHLLWLLVMVMCASGAMNALILHQVPAMQATGISLAAASALAGARGLFQIPGRVVLTPLTTRAGVPGATLLCYALFIVGTLALLGAGPLVLVGLFVVATGLAVGLLSPLHGLYSAEVYGEARLGTLMGVQQVAVAAAGAAGPWLAGVGYDITGSYAMPLVAIAAVQMLAVAALAMQRRTTRAVAPSPSLDRSLRSQAGRLSHTPREGE